MQEDRQIDYDVLISKYLFGQAQDHEIKILEDWVKAAPENRERFVSTKNAWILSGVHAKGQKFDTEKAWQQISGPMDRAKKETTSRRFSIGGWMRVAAAVILLLLGYQLIDSFVADRQEVQFVSRMDPADQVLPDGSAIMLNRQTEISYSASKDTRTLRLSGDAFFDIRRDTTRPFVIKTEHIRVEVLGTSFYIDARPDQNLSEVYVKSGIVRCTAQNQSLILKKGETAIYDKSTKRLVSGSGKNENYLAWQTKQLYFEQEELSDVVFDLQRSYGVRIIIDNPALKSCKITATFDRKSLDQVIAIISKTLNLKVKKNDHKIILLGDRCH